jgi:ribosomal protein S18 acetylase RimI-like enzyme
VAAILYAAGALGVYAVATAPGHGRRGYAEALLRHALAESRQRWGKRRMVLQATQQGLSLYRRMGFAGAGGFLVYSS